jgi:hypothetical protein
MRFESQFEGREYLPRATRVDVYYEAWLKRADGDVPVQILNISSEGLRLRSPSRLEVGSEILVAVAKLYPVRAIVRWSDGFDAGGQFCDPVAL